MAKTVVTAGSIGGTYSATTAHATSARGFVSVTGQVANQPGMDPRDHPDEAQQWGTIEEQTVRVMENIKAIASTGLLTGLVPLARESRSTLSLSFPTDCHE